MKRLIILLIVIVCTIGCWAQVGYQVSLLNKATGEPRANETVSVTVEISDSRGGVFYNKAISATTNDFGVLSLSVGDGTTFANVNWNNLPLYISATVDGVLIGRSQILSVPVAEHAKHYGSLTKDILKSKSWKLSVDYGRGEFYQGSLSFHDNTVVVNHSRGFDDAGVPDVSTYTVKYYIVGDVVVFAEDKDYMEIFLYSPEGNFLFGNRGKYK